MPNIQGAFYFALGAASGVAARRMWQRLSQDAGKEGTQWLLHGAGVALSIGREVTRKASRFVEDVEDMVAEAQAELDQAQGRESSPSG
jgi:hypothetical protein